MPKKIATIKKREWLKAYEEGRPITSIAKDEKCDVRTLKKGIQEARLERDATLARADLIREALRSHNESLLEVIRGILSAVEVPASDQAIPWKHESIYGSIRIEGGEVQYEIWPEVKVTGVTLDMEDGIEWELLQEHLKLDRSWRLLGQWKKALAAHLEARIIMKHKLAALLQNKTGYQLADKPIEGCFLYSHSVDLLFQQAIQRLPKLVDSSGLENHIIIDSESGDVRYGIGTILAHAPEAEQECRQHILDTFKELVASTEAQNVINTYEESVDLTAKVRRSAEEIRILRLVPGQCRICRRLGT